MKVTLNWLKQYVEFHWSPAELAERLTMLGLEVEGMQKLSGEFDGVVVAEVLTRDKVPGSDKLSVCKVNDGQGERTIICGAQNHQPGDKVPLILPNFALPLKAGEKEPFIIKERKVFGITSQGMMCSPQELGLPDPVDGLLILPKAAKTGQPFAEHLGRTGSDVVYDLEITPNRPDLNSVIGIAREIAALTGNALRLPETGIATGPNALIGAAPGTTVDHYVAVRLDEPELCPRYTARVVLGVNVGPSPDWLRATLEKVGLRSINNVVDVTNYVMLETGQPLHAFDYRLITRPNGGESLKREANEVSSAAPLQGFNSSTPTIVVRRAGAGEKFTTLDGEEHKLTSEMLLIADARKGIALAGVMGGQNSEITDATRDVLIESAYFSPTMIRRTSKIIGLRSDSSYRFERGCDIGITDYASTRAAKLILQLAGGQLVPGAVDSYPKPAEPKQLTLRHHKVNEILGLNLRPEEIEYHLGQLGLQTVNRNVRPVGDDTPPAPATFLIPTFRVDLKREVDLIEEVARVYGVDKIPSTVPRAVVGFNSFDSEYDEIACVRRLLTGLGLDEACGQTLVGHAECRIPDADIVALENPLSSDMDVLRPSLMPGLLNILRHNLSRKNHDVALFEVGRVFSRAGTAGRIKARPQKPADEEVRMLKEERRVAIALTGRRAPAFWSGENREARFDAADLRGIIEELLEYFGLRGVVFGKLAEAHPLFLESATITLGGKMSLGEMGQLLPALARQYDIRDAVFLAELRLDELLARRNDARYFKPLPQFPAIRRDVAMLLPDGSTHDAVLAAVKQAKPANLESMELFDVFRGKNVPEGQKSMAYAFTYRSPERTLTDAEVNAAHEKLIFQFKASLGAVVRDT